MGFLPQTWRTVIFVSVFFTLSSCQWGSSPKADAADAALKGNAASHLYRPKVPQKLVCQRVGDEPRGRPEGTEGHDLILERQGDGSYNGTIFGAQMKVQKGQRDVTLTRLVIEGGWYYHHTGVLKKSLMWTESRLLNTLRFTYIPENDGEFIHSTLDADFWPPENNETISRMMCLDQTKLASRPPTPGDRLYVVSGAVHPVTRVVERITQAVTVDALVSSGSAVEILSLTNRLPLGQLPPHAPVYDREGALVGYVKAHRKGALVGISITSVHDPRLGASLKTQLLGQESFAPGSIGHPLISVRFVEEVCRLTLPKVPMDCGSWSLSISKALGSCSPRPENFSKPPASDRLKPS